MAAWVDAVARLLADFLRLFAGLGETNIGERADAHLLLLLGPLVFHDPASAAHAGHAEIKTAAVTVLAFAERFEFARVQPLGDTRHFLQSFQPKGREIRILSLG